MMTVVEREGPEVGRTPGGSADRVEERRLRPALPGGALPGVVFLAVVLALLVYAVLLPGHNPDTDGYLIPWYQYLLAHGRFEALGHAFANYTPPYLYLLSLASLLDGLVPPLLAVKLVSVAGSLFLAVASYRLLSVFLDRRPAASWGAAVLLLPTVAANGPLWGQCDSIWAGAVILAIASFLRERPLAGMVFLGVALAFKLQAVFIAPFILLLLLTGRLPPVLLPVPLLVYALCMVPAWLAGRPALELATVYAEQGGFYRELAMGAPNIWTIVRSLDIVGYETGVLIGLALAVLTTAGLAAYAYTLGWGREGGARGEAGDLRAKDHLLLVALAAAALLPYLLPKMHDRYMFLADVLAFVAAVVRPTARRIAIACLVQLGSLSAYLTFLVAFGPGSHLGAGLMGLALLLLLVEVLRQRAAGPHASSGRRADGEPEASRQATPGPAGSAA